MLSKQTSILCVSLFLAFGGSLVADPVYDAFKNCIQSTTNATCTLPYGSYTATYAINVTRSVTIQGQASAGSYPTITRASNTPTFPPALPNLFVITGQSATVPTVTFQNLVIDGNRAGNGIPAYPASLNVQTVAGHHIEDYAGTFVDLVVQPSNTSDQNCWRCVVINNVTFQNQPGYALQMSRSGIMVEYSTFNSAFLTGILSYASLYDPLYLEIYWSNFDNNNSGVSLNAGGGGAYAGQYTPNKSPSVNANQFYNNGREFADRWECGGAPNVWGPCGTGQVFTLTSGVTFYDNTFQGNTVNGCNSYWCLPIATEALELQGPNGGHRVVSNPTITGHLVSGVEITGMNNVEIDGNAIQESNTMTVAGQLLKASGIILRTVAAAGLKQNNCVNVQANTITYAQYGLWDWWNETGALDPSGITVNVNNVFSPNSASTNVFNQPGAPTANPSCPSWIFSTP
jgi:hypothetical protein